MIKAVFVDIDNTLLDFDKCAAHSLKIAFEVAGVAYKDDYYAAFSRATAYAWDLIERSCILPGEIAKVRWEMIEHILGITLDGDTLEEAFRNSFFYSAQKVEHADELLATLGKHFDLYAASNGPYEQQIARLKNANMLHLFKGVAVSEKVGAYKPNRKFFESCLKMAGRKAQECLMIGDSLSADIQGARACGFATCWFARGAERVGDEADFIVDDLLQIPPLLGI